MVDGFDPVREPDVQLSLDPSVIRASVSLLYFLICFPLFSFRFA